MRIALMGACVVAALSLHLRAWADARSDNAYRQMMATERASTQAIRDSMRFVNQAGKDTGTHWSQPIVEALNKSSPAQSARDTRELAARYQALQNQQKVQMLEGLASSGYLPAIVELGEAHLSGDIGLSSNPTKALDYLRRAAQLGDATSAYNAAVAAKRAGRDAEARPLFEQAARAGVRGAAYRVALEAMNTADWSGAIAYGKQAAADKSAVGAYIVCVAAQAGSPPQNPYANRLTSEYCPLAYDLGYPDSAEDAGNGLANHGDWTRALTYYLRCSERTGSRYCLRGAGMSAFKAQKWPEADQLLTKAIAAGDNDEHAQLILALIAIHGEPKQWDNAERMLKAVLQHQGPKSAEAHFHLAAVYSLWPDKEFPGELIDGHLYASARGGYGEAQQMLREAGKSW